MSTIARWGCCDDPEAVAGVLMDEFGSAAAAVTASSEQRARRSAGDQAAEALAAFRRCMIHVLRERLEDRPLLDGWRPLVDYLRAAISDERVEEFRVLYLNVRNRLIADEVASRGTIDTVHVHVREVIHRALDLGAGALILVHNHPSGDATPSRADIAITRSLLAAGTPLGVTLHDHFIVSSTGHKSLRADGLM